MTYKKTGTYTERPISFNGEMVRAIDNGRKTQTRRPVKGLDDTYKMVVDGKVMKENEYGDFEELHNPHGKAGDYLWVRETWAKVPIFSPGGNAYILHNPEITIYRADGIYEKPQGGWKPPVSMKCEDSRLWLVVCNTKLERLHDISEADAIAEGIDMLTADGSPVNPFDEFIPLWDSIYGKTDYRAEKNPWVWVTEFVKVGKTMRS